MAKEKEPSEREIRLQAGREKCKRVIELGVARLRETGGASPMDVEFFRSSWTASVDFMTSAKEVHELTGAILEVESRFKASRRKDGG